MTLPIRWKVTLGTLLAIACGLIIAGILAIRSLERQETAQLNLMLDARTSLVAYGLAPWLRSSPSPTSLSQLRSVVRELSARALARITVVSPDGRVLADSAVADNDLPAVENHRSRPEILQALTTGRGTDIRPSHTTGERTLYLAVAVKDLGQPDSSMLLRLGMPMAQLDQEIKKLQRSLTIAFGSAFLISVAFSMWLARSITQPLSDIATVAQQLVAGIPGIRIQTTARDEVGLLADTLNRMTDQLGTKIRELSEDRAQLLAMLISMVEGVMVLDYRGTVLQVNPALERMLYVSGSEARGRNYAEVIRHPQLIELTSTVLKTRMGQGEEITLAPTGKCLQVEASVAGGQRENEACVVLVFHDITELRRLEKIRKDFVANVSHELRTPLTSIKGYVEALLDGRKDDPKTTTDFLEIILKQSDRLNLIIEDLLELSKIESGQVLFKREPFHVQNVIERTLATMKPLADKKGHRLISWVAPDLPLVIGDEEHLVQVLTNLIDNAIKYTPEDGTVTVAAHRATSGPSPTGSMSDQIDLTVTDTGMGIPEQDRPRVFERFYRVDKARSRELGGTGLGLAIVKHIVEGHGGQVWVEANVPTGSRFVVRLPVNI
jgi:two-component system, OmpR family, phosphate regulon sensor histidine kinase PhoR